MSRQNLIWPGLAILLFFGALFWAKEQDPFSREWFAVKAAGSGSFKCVAVLPKPMRRYPVVIYAHDSGGTLMTDGNDLRQMAELGLAVVSLDYDQTNDTIFTAQFEGLLHYVAQQQWADTNAIAWVGFSLGANRLSDFTQQHPEQQPQLLVLLSDTRLSEAQTNGLPARLKILPIVQPDMESERGVIFREVGESCLTHLAGKGAWQNYHSIAQWQAEAPALWLFWLPAAAWGVGWFMWWRRSKAGSSEKVKLSRGEVALRWLAVLLATWASAETALHLVPPHFAVSNTTLSIARRILVQPKQRTDFEFLAAQPIWHGEKLKTLLEHVELAVYNRELINWQLDDKIYRDYVLSPVITGRSDEQLNWRRPLWEEFYPRIRHENSPEEAARIVVRHLRERVTIATLPNLPQDVPAIWLRQITDETGFEIIRVAALRSVGVPARLDSSRHAEFWDGSKWQPAPEPVTVP